MPRIWLTDRFVASAKSDGANQTDYFDEQNPGLSLRCSRTCKAWSYVYTSPANGKRARISLGGYPAVSLAKARGLALEARQRVEDGSDPRGQAHATSDLTFADLVARCLADPDKANLRTIREIRRRFDRYVLPIIGAVRLDKLVRRDVRNVVEPILKRDARVQARHALKDIRAVLRWGVKHEFLPANPIDGMETPSGSTPRERTLSDAEIHKLWAALPVALAKSRACQRIIQLALITGQRLGEISGMARSELDLDRKLWSLPGSRVKNGHPHVVPLSNSALEIIRQVIADAGTREFVFPAEDGGALSRVVITRAITRAHETRNERGRFGIEPWCGHDLRRTCLNGLAKLGVSPHVIAHVANHRSVTKSGVTFAHYVTHAFEGEKRTALDLWDQRLQAIVAGDGAQVLPLKRA